MAKSDGAKSEQRPGPSEDVKRKFREALEKKQSHAGRDVSDDTEHGKVDHAQAAATTATQQMFRRKSGG